MPDPYRELTEEQPQPASAPVPELVPVETKETLPQPEKEKPAENVMPIEQPAVSVASSTAPSTAGPTPPAATQDAQNLRAYEKNQQLKALVDLAFTKGVTYASDVARQLDSPYLMDEFHDTLVDELHKELVQRGKLEEV